jgi:hypothetical protein
MRLRGIGNGLLLLLLPGMLVLVAGESSARTQ